MLTYHRPTSLDDALSILGAASGVACVYSGGTDVLPRWQGGLLRRADTVVDIKRIEGLKGIDCSDGVVRIGANTLMSELASDPVIRSAASVLALAAGRVACPQIRNRATIGGNLCNASPAADTAVPLILLEATLELASLENGAVAVRELVITDFFQGPGSTALAEGEILTAIRFKPMPEGWFSVWDKFGTRPAMEIAVASAGVALRVEQGSVAEARIGYGSVAPIPLRGRQAEVSLVGRRLSDSVIGECVAAAREEISPITDVRASADYRREILGVMLRRMLKNAGSG